MHSDPSDERAVDPAEMITIKVERPPNFHFDDDEPTVEDDPVFATPPGPRPEVKLPSGTRTESQPVRKKGASVRPLPTPRPRRRRTTSGQFPKVG